MAFCACAGIFPGAAPSLGFRFATAKGAVGEGLRISNFEFVFSLLVILLGLALAQLLGGLASAVKRRPALKIGWATALLATWVTTETVIFWEIVWRTRDVMPPDSPALFPGFAITGLYYFAAALVFPDDLASRESLDDYFMREKAQGDRRSPGGGRIGIPVEGGDHGHGGVDRGAVVRVGVAGDHLHAPAPRRC